MRVFLTGASGFVGGHTAEALVRVGHSVTAYGRSESPPVEAAAVGARVVTGRWDDAEALGRAAAGHEAIICVGDPALSDPKYAEKHERMLRALGASAADTRDFRRFVYLSSLTVALMAREQPVREDTPVAVPVNDIFTQSKRWGEKFLAESGLPVTVVRRAPAYGPRWRVLASLVQRMMRYGEAGLPFPGRVTHLWPFIHVEDCAAALVSGIADESGRYTVYHACDDEPMTIADAMGLLSAELGVTLKFRTFPLSLQKSMAWMFDQVGILSGGETVRSILELFLHDYRFENARLKERLGVRLKYPSLRTGIHGTAQWLREELGL